MDAMSEEMITREGIFQLQTCAGASLMQRLRLN